MHMNRSIPLTGALITWVAFGVAGHSNLALAEQPLNYQTELQAHPNIAHALHDLQTAQVELEKSPDEFSGLKPNAIHDIRVAIHTLKKAMYYRLKLDDAAIDKAP